MPNEGRKASSDVAVGILWRLAIFLIAAVAFDGLLSLRTWETSYAASDAWAHEVAKQGEWGSVVAFGATGMPQQPYPKDALYEKVLARLKVPAGQNENVPARLSEYRGFLSTRATLTKSLNDQIQPWDKRLESKSTALMVNQQEIDAANDQLANLTDPKTSQNRTAIAAARKRQKKAVDQRIAIRDDLTQLDADRARIVVPIQKQITDLDAKIKDAETNIRAAFDATVSYARPTTSGWARYVSADKAIHIGNRDDPLHIVNDIASYGLQALIVFIICIVFVPWVLKLAGDSGDPNAAKSAVTQRVRQFLTDAFSRTGGQVAGRVVAATMVAGISALAVNAAAQHKPEEPPGVVQPGDRGPQGSPGTKGKDAQFPPEVIARLQEQMNQIELQRRALETHTQTIAALTASLGAVNTAVNNTTTAITGLTNNSGLMVNNLGSLLEKVGTLNQTVSTINNSVAGIAAVNADFIRHSMAYNELSLRSLDTLVKAAEMTDRKIDSVTTNVHTLTTVTMPKIEGAFLQTNLLQDDGFFDRMWRGYQVTPVGIDIVRTMVPDPREGAGKSVLDAMDTVRKAQKEPYSRAQLMKNLRAAAGTETNEEAGALLDLLEPTILKVSRIPRGSL